MVETQRGKNGRVMSLGTPGTATNPSLTELAAGGESTGIVLNIARQIIARRV